MRPEQHAADQLRRLGDDLVLGRPAVAQSEIEESMQHAYEVMETSYKEATAMPSTIKNEIWEDIMHTSPHTLNSSLPHLDIPGIWTRGVIDSRRPFSRWQAAMSLAAVFGLLVSVVFLTFWHQEFSSQNTPPGGTQNVLAPMPTDVPVQLPESCIANATIPTDDDLLSDTTLDWTQSTYSPVQSVNSNQADAIQQTYLNYLRCEWDGSHGGTPAAAETPQALVERKPELLTYFSERLRFERMLNELPSATQQTVREFQCYPRIESILASFPLPVNQPLDEVAIGDATIPIFSPSDVYRLPDGRFGAVAGTISTSALTNPAAGSVDDNLMFVAFVESGGTYYIDEFFTLVSADMANIVQGGWNGTLPNDCGKN